jgi:hypothetical protein
VDSVKLERSNVRNQHPKVPSRNIDTSLVLRLLEIARCAVDETQTGICLPVQLAVDSLDLEGQILLCLGLARASETRVDANPAVRLVDNLLATAVGSDSWGVYTGHADAPLRRSARYRAEEGVCKLVM